MTGSAYERTKIKKKFEMDFVWVAELLPKVYFELAIIVAHFDNTGLKD